MSSGAHGLWFQAESLADLVRLNKVIKIAVYNSVIDVGGRREANFKGVTIMRFFGFS